MNHILETFARQWIKNHIIFCSRTEIKLFIKMYSLDETKGVILTIETMPQDRLDQAMAQIYRTLIKRKYL